MHRKKVGGGNCFYKAISQVLTGSQTQHEEVRRIVAKYAITTHFPDVHVGRFTGKSSHVTRSGILHSDTWTTESEVMHSCCQPAKH